MHIAQQACALVRLGLLLLRHRVLYGIQRELAVVAHLHCGCVTVVDNVAVSAVSSQRTRQYLHRQAHCARLARFDILQRPGDDTVRKHATVIRGYKLYVLIQFILNDNVSSFALVVPVRDLVGDLIAYMHVTQQACAFVRLGLLLLRHRVLHRVQLELAVIANLHRRRIAVVDDVSITAVGGQCARQHLHRQGDSARLARFNIRKRPGNNTVAQRPAVIRRHKLYVLIQFVLDNNVSCFTLVVPVRDLVGNLVAYMHVAQQACAFVRLGFLLLRHRILYGVQRELAVVADLHRGSVAAIDNVAASAVAC